MPAREAGYAEVLFDDLAFEDDVCRPGGEIAAAVRRDYEQHGVAVADLLACDEEGRDSTRLPGCVKVYLPQPAGRFGMVFAIHRQAGRLLLAYLAFGVRHHPYGSNAPTVYQIADRRLHEQRG
jgi:hypothetical protein